MGFFGHFYHPPHPISHFYIPINLYILKIYFHDNYVLRILQFCMYEFTVVHKLFIFVYLLCLSQNKKKKNVSCIAWLWIIVKSFFSLSDNRLKIISYFVNFRSMCLNSWWFNIKHFTFYTSSWYQWIYSVWQFSFK